MCLLLECRKSQSVFKSESDTQTFLNGVVLFNGRWVDLYGTLKWSRGRTIVAPGEKHQQSLAIRTEDTGHVSKLCVKAFFLSGKFHS